MAQLFDGYDDDIRIPNEEIDATTYGEINWRDGAAVHASGLVGEPAFKGVITKDRWTKVNERSRTYHFAGGVATSVENVSWLWVSSSGTHYLREANGTVHIIAKGWFRIAITE